MNCVTALNLTNRNLCQEKAITNPFNNKQVWALVNVHYMYLAYDVVLVVLLVQTRDGGDDLGNLLLEFITGHQVTH